MLSHSDIPEAVQHAIFPLTRWLHLVCTTLLVGGTLFYEFVIPQAIEDLKEESQLAVLGRVRWFFRKVVILSTYLLVITGLIGLWQHWPSYLGIYHVVKPWVLVHVGIGALSLALGIGMMRRTRAPRHPLTWLRVNFVILLTVMFVGAVCRHIRLSVTDNIEHDNPGVFEHYYPVEPPGQ